VLANDVALDGPAKTIAFVNSTAVVEGTVVTLASGATVTLTGGKLVYDPNGKFNKLTGADSGGTNRSATETFTYSEADGETATVTVTVNGLVSAGDDIVGGPGDNTFTVTDLADKVIEDPNAGTDTVRTDQGLRAPPFTSLFVLAANVENLIGTATTGQGVRANSLNNVITMGSGNDLVVLDDGGNDDVDGGAGNDYIYYGGAFDAADVTKGGAGTDTLALGGGNYSNLTLGAESISGIEKIVLLGSASVGGTGPFQYKLTTVEANVGSTATLQIIATSLGADETLVFNGSAETDGGRFAIQGGAGADNLTGGAKRDHLAGNGGADVINGGAGNDTLIGGAGADELTGGSGTDFFTFKEVSDSSGLKSIPSWTSRWARTNGSISPQSMPTGMKRAMAPSPSLAPVPLSRKPPVSCGCSTTPASGKCRAT
jgi:Ca2+-binding RTX toxin-like protein